MKHINMTFKIDKRILSTCFKLGDWPLSSVLIKDNAFFPWFILVPRLIGIQDIEELEEQQRYLLVDEISKLSSIVRHNFSPNKINVGALGNMVSQLHVHVVARFTYDDLWPHGIWQEELKTIPYSEERKRELLQSLKHQIKNSFSRKN